MHKTKMSKAEKLHSKKIYYRAMQYEPCPPGVKLINVLFAGARLLRTGYQNRVQTSGLGAVRTSLAPGTTSSQAAPLRSRAKCEGKHLNIHVIWESCILAPQSVTYTITSLCSSLIRNVNIKRVFYDCLAKFKYLPLLCNFNLSSTNYSR